MSPGKLASQVSHASMAFLTSLIRSPDNIYKITKGLLAPWGSEPTQEDWNEVVSYEFEYIFDKDLYEQWIDGEFTKVVLQARNKNHLLKAKTIAEELGMKEGEDFFFIKDSCRTELEPEEDERTLTCIGFKPMNAEIIDKVSKKYQLYQ